MVENSQRTGANAARAAALEEKMTTLKKYLEVVQPFKTSELIFNAVFQACEGRQFNKVCDFYEGFYGQLEAKFNSYEEDLEDDESGEWLSLTYAIPSNRERVPEEQLPALPGSGHSALLDKLRSGRLAGRSKVGSGAGGAAKPNEKNEKAGRRGGAAGHRKSRVGHGAAQKGSGGAGDEDGQS